MAAKPMDERRRTRFQEGAAQFLEGDEQVEEAIEGLRYSFGAWVLNTLRLGTPNRWVLVTNRNVYVLELGNSRGVVKGKTPSSVLAKHPRGTLTASKRMYPMKFSIGDQHVTPTIFSAPRIKPIVEAANQPAQAGATAAAR